jgi:hypothetical protein
VLVFYHIIFCGAIAHQLEKILLHIKNDLIFN